MTRNPYGLKIEVNMSIGTKYIDNILSFSPKKANLLGSHNFYPMEFSGLAEDFYQQCCQQFKQYDLETAAFISSAEGPMGPWPLQDGLCTLEAHRYLPIDVQAQYFVMDDKLDTIIIGNAYASEKELTDVAAVYFATHPTLSIALADEITAVEKAILFDELHSYRGDRSDYLLRSSMPRFIYKSENIPPRESKSYTRGDVVVANNNFGKLTPESISILSSLKPWSKFKLTK